MESSLVPMIHCYNPMQQSLISEYLNLVAFSDKCNTAAVTNSMCYVKGDFEDGFELAYYL